MAADGEIVTIEGAVGHVVYRAPDGRFGVIRVDTAESPLPLTVIGQVAEVMPGELLRIEGRWEKHAQHGRQFRADRVVAEVPKSPDGVARYLQTLRGIGPELAKRIVAEFGVEAIEKLEQESWRVAQVKGVGKRRAAMASKDAAERRAEREIMVFLQGLGISAAYAARIRKVYGPDAVQKVRENPYRLARDVAGIGFVVADRIAQGMGVAVDSPLRLEAGLLHALEQFAEEGHVFAPTAELVDRGGALLGAASELLRVPLARLIAEKAIVQRGEASYLKRFDRLEADVAKRLLALLDVPPTPLKTRAPATVTLSPSQLRALEVVGQQKVAVITGGPGTGKTTLVRTLVQSWRDASRRVVLAAPTGRASRRLKEATGHPAQTLHRLLEWGRGEGRTAFARNAANPIEADLIVVDEASMIDLPLFAAFIEAVDPHATLVLVGDVDQLPSVGPGQILADLMRSGVIPTVRLTEVFRQAEGSGIIESAYQILGGDVPSAVSHPPARDAARNDFYFVDAEEPARALDLVLKLVRERVPQAFALDPVKDVQVLVPMHRGTVGTESLNRALKEALNPGDGLFSVGDKVIQIRNNYDRDVFNGDVGFIALANDAGYDVDFDGRRVHYELDEVNELELAYAITVHKSQGSEYAAVIVPILMQHRLLLQRNLLYTAVTRGKKLVVLVGDKRAIEMAARTTNANTRHSSLANRLNRTF